MTSRHASVIFTPNEFYERLINLRRSHPAAFARFAVETNERLRAYEEAKNLANERRAENRMTQREENNVQ